MTRKTRLLICFNFVFVFALLICCAFAPVCVASASAVSSGAKGWCLINVNSKEIICGKNEDVKLPMASTTKILTAVVALEKMDINKVITVDKTAVGVEGSSIYLKQNEQISVKDLLYGLMLRSGNDSAVALAVACSGSVENFAKEMNEKAKSIGANNSSFTNPHGLDDENHFTTAKDLALITAYALQNPTFKEIVSTKMHTVAATNVSETRYFKNKNKMLSTFEGAIGVKTGYTKKTGRCLVSAAERDGTTLACVVLSCPDMWNDSARILEFGFKAK